MYRVRWEIDVPAASSEEAARKALASMRRPDTTATVFDVTAPDGTASRVDLGAQQDTGVINTLLAALKHAERRLNEIPHRYDDTNFRLIREALIAGAATQGRQP